MAKHLAQRSPEPFVLLGRDPVGPPPRANARSKKALIGINVAHTGKQPLIQQRSLDGQVPAAKQGRKLIGSDVERLRARRRECRIRAKRAEFEPAEAPRIDEPQLAATRQLQARMGMRGKGAVGCRHKELPGHSQVYDPLRIGQFGLLAIWYSPSFLTSLLCLTAAQLEDDVLPSAMHCQDRTSDKAVSLPTGWILERLRIGAEPCVDDAVAAHAFIYAARNGFNLGQLRHRFIVEDRFRRASCGASEVDLNSTSGRNWAESLSARLSCQPGIFLVRARLRSAPLLQIDNADDKPDEKNSHRGVLNNVEFAIFRRGLVDRDAMNLAGNYAHLLGNWRSGHGVKVMR